VILDRVRDRAMAGLARQLSHPDGVRGRLVMRGLNRGNRDAVLAAVAVASAAPSRSEGSRCSWAT
jgi:hypothetical protein